MIKHSEMPEEERKGKYSRRNQLRILLRRDLASFLDDPSDDIPLVQITPQMY